MIGQFIGEHNWLSNFESSVVSLDGHYYQTVEHAYQAAKTFNEDERKKIREAERPATAKKYGNTVTLRNDWEQVKLTIMHELLTQKFWNSKELADKLITSAGDLIEGNWWGDVYWGVCEGKGNNHLGQLLMIIRDELRERYY